MDLPFSMEYVTHAIEEEKEQKAWGLWQTIYPFMSMKWINNINYPDFKSKLYQKVERTTHKSMPEIASEMLLVVEAYKRQVK